MSARWLFVVALGSCLAPSVVRAQPWSGDAKRTATAQALFDEARDLMKGGDFARACPKLEEAVKLEPNGVGGKLKLAECYEGGGKLASAYALYSVVEAAARANGQSDRAAWARDRGAALRPKVSVLIIDVDEALAEVDGFVVLRDGIEVGKAQWGVPIPVDGGDVAITASAPGRVAFTHTATLKSESDSVRVAVQGLAPVAREPAAPPVKPQPKLPAAPPRVEEAEPGGGEVPAWAWATGATGLGLGIVGAALRIHAATIESDQADHCGPSLDQCPPSYDVAGTNDQKQLEFDLFVGFTVVGAAGLGAGIVGAIVGATTGAPAKPRVSFWADSAPAGAVVGLQGALP